MDLDPFLTELCVTIDDAWVAHHRPPGRARPGRPPRLSRSEVARLRLGLPAGSGARPGRGGGRSGDGCDNGHRRL